MSARHIVFSSIACAILGAVGGYGYGHTMAITESVDGDATDPLLSGVRWTPCFETPGSASIVQSHTEWVAQMDAKGLDSATDITTVPRGRNKGEWILPGCVAFETSIGGVVYWRDRTNTSPAWVPYPGMTDADAASSYHHGSYVGRGAALSATAGR